MKLLLGCCLIHLCIGSIYSISVLYPQFSQLTGWNTSTLVYGFSISILALGFSASFHQKIFSKISKTNVLIGAIVCWTFSQLSILGVIKNSLNEIFYFLSCGILGIGIGLLYVITINIVSKYGFKYNGLANGVVIFYFGFGSFLSSKLFFEIPLIQLYGIYTLLMLFGVYLINTKDTIESPQTFQRDKTWYMLSIMFLTNIGIGISLLSNLANLSTNRGISVNDSIIIVALCGLFNSLGRLAYSFLSDYVGKLNTTLSILILQGFSIMSIVGFNFWNVPIFLVISVYGGVFSIMPSLMKEIYGDKSSIAYSQILAMWGIAGLIFPPIFVQFGLNLLIILSCITIIIPIIIKFKMLTSQIES